MAEVTVGHNDRLKHTAAAAFVRRQHANARISPAQFPKRALEDASEKGEDPL